MGVHMAANGAAPIVSRAVTPWVTCRADKTKTCTQLAEKERSQCGWRMRWHQHFAIWVLRYLFGVNGANISLCVHDAVYRLGR